MQNKEELEGERCKTRGKDAKQGRVRGRKRLKGEEEEEEEIDRITSKELKPLSGNERKIQNEI